MYFRSVGAANYARYMKNCLYIYDNWNDNDDDDDGDEIDRMFCLEQRAKGRCPHFQNGDHNRLVERQWVRSRLY